MAREPDEPPRDAVPEPEPARPSLVERAFGCGWREIGALLFVLALVAVSVALCRYVPG
ncbi:hypothetical protein LWC35_35165 [Pseudonocardia kujensis]|uniref:hypothetical protein n=1 Tax=Pseudonocardia kujensis TaxID=1128675 RepID=UPI001E558CB9|nr:hypothetical protein [Pseudonocardia kujensis]MCE0768097.1 hypothetical protein [Pseudonocardia kujensis]